MYIRRILNRKTGAESRLCTRHYQARLDAYRQQHKGNYPFSLLRTWDGNAEWEIDGYNPDWGMPFNGKARVLSRAWVCQECARDEYMAWWASKLPRQAELFGGKACG